VQKQAIPIIMQGKDLICQARSGMGKTAVFVIGILNQVPMRDG
jgi:superfamily II DNA/RNA helicase